MLAAPLCAMVAPAEARVSRRLHALAWPSSQAWLPAGGAARCSRQNVSKHMRSGGDANGPCMALRPRFV